SDWQYTSQPFASYDDLPAGSYEFQVQAINRDFALSKVLSVPVSVTPPYERYATTAAAICFAILAAGLILGIFVRTRSENTRLATEVAEGVKKEMVLMEQLVDSQRLESLGTVAAGIAHDFNNSLQVISSNTELALCQLDSRNPEQIDSSRELLGLVGDASHQAATLARSLLTFGRQTEQKRERVVVGEFLEDTTKMIRHVLPASIDTSFEWTSVNEEWFSVDTTQISQVITNLCVNGRDAMPEGGRLEIHANVCERNDLRYVQVLVRDSGEGIAPENLSRVFDPFFTSKAKEHGTGLGLSIVHGIITAHQGLINVESAVGIGTSIELLIPSLGQHEQESTAEKKELLRRFDGAHAKVAVADDRRAVRDSMNHVLADCNYEVVEYQNGEEVVEQFDTIRSEISAIILNVDMPRRSGRSVWSTLRSLGYEGRIVLVSGYPEQLPSPIDENTRCLAKPFTNAEMLQALATSSQPAAPHLGGSRVTT
ncbi:MAG: ATP-binding protein, partial [Planctomycetota bacterium]